MFLAHFGQKNKLFDDFFFWKSMLFVLFPGILSSVFDEFLYVFLVFLFMFLANFRYVFGDFFVFFW